METQVIDDILLWLSVISIAAICTLMLYYGVTGIAKVPGIHDGLARQGFAAAGYLLFILVPLMIFNLVVDSTVISELFERSMSALYILVIADILAMIALYLVQ